MIDSKFWKEVRKNWIIETSSKSTNSVSESYNDEEESVPFDFVDPDKAYKDIINGRDILGRGKTETTDQNESGNKTETTKPQKPIKPPFDTERFAGLVEKGDIKSFSSAFNMLSDYGLPDKMEELFRNIAETMLTLDETVKKFEGIYKADMSQFYEYHIPETLELASTYIEYESADIDSDIINKTQKEVVSAAETLLTGLEDKKNELYEFGFMELKARAKALESLMGQDGHVPKDSRID